MKILKITFFLITISFTVNYCVGQNVYKNNLSMLKLKGDVKYVKDTSFVAIDKFGEFLKGAITSCHFYSFNNNGDLNSYYRYNSSTSSNDEIKDYSFISHNLEFNSSVYSDDEVFSIYSTDNLNKLKQIYKYDNKNKIIERDLYYSESILKYKSEMGKPSSGLWFKETYIYNSKDNMIERNGYEEDNSLAYKWLMKYDENGKKIENTCYKSDGSFNLKHTYKYDFKGRIIELKSYNAEGNLLDSETFKYDDNGNMTEFRRYYNNGSLDYKAIYNYDAKGNLIEQILNGHKVTYKFDNFGSIIEKITYKYDGINVDKKNTFQYIYDKKGNWIKKTDFNKNGIQQAITDRVIIYYSDHIDLEQKSEIDTVEKISDVVHGNSILSYNMLGRQVKSIPKPNYNSNDEGTVVVTIWVDKNGNVINAVAGDRGTTTTNQTLWKLAEESAKNAKFNASATAPEEQKGTIIYSFIHPN